MIAMIKKWIQNYKDKQNHKKVILAIHGELTNNPSEDLEFNLKVNFSNSNKDIQEEQKFEATYNLYRALENLAIAYGKTPKITVSIEDEEGVRERYNQWVTENSVAYSS